MTSWHLNATSISQCDKEMVTTCTRGMECQLANPLKCERERLSPSPVIHGHVPLSVTEALLSGPCL